MIEVQDGLKLPVQDPAVHIQPVSWEQEEESETELQVKDRRGGKMKEKMRKWKKRFIKIDLKIKKFVG